MPHGGRGATLAVASNEVIERGDGDADQEDHRNALADLDLQERVAELLDRWRLPVWP
jgi:hypothetical protein